MAADLAGDQRNDEPEGCSRVKLSRDATSCLAFHVSRPCRRHALPLRSAHGPAWTKGRSIPYTPRFCMPSTYLARAVLPDDIPGRLLGIANDGVSENDITRVASATAILSNRGHRKAAIINMIVMNLTRPLPCNYASGLALRGIYAQHYSPTHLHTWSDGSHSRITILHCHHGRHPTATHSLIDGGWGVEFVEIELAHGSGAVGEAMCKDCRRYRS